MCGIVGFIDRSVRGPDADARINAMLKLIHHRGPDGEGRHFADEYGLAVGMRRLSIIDLVGGGQPIWNETKEIGVVFNGEIYNFIELRSELVAAGHQFATLSDTEVLVHAYEQWGIGILQRLRGMFTFCIFDLKQGKALLARDHFGQKHLYFCSDGDKFAFASELKALLPLPFVSREVDQDAVLDVVSFLALPAPSTVLKHVKKISPGSYILIDLHRPSEVVLREYWQPDMKNVPDLETEEAAVSALDSVLTDSVNVHLRADVPVGVLLSGGLDSRTIAAYSKRIMHDQLHTFSVGFLHSDSEGAEAEKTAKEIGTIHHPETLSHHHLSDYIDQIAWHLDEPVGDPAAFAVYHVCKLAREHVKVVLGGEGADELFGGYSTRYESAIHYVKVSRRFACLRNILPDFRGDFPQSRMDRLRRRIHMTSGGQIIGLRSVGFPGNVLSPKGLSNAQLRRLLKRQRELADQMFRPQRDILTSMLALDLRWELPEYLLLKADKMSMAASIEMRSPFLDVEVFKVASRICSNLKLHPDGIGKWALRKCLAKLMPEPMTRPKKGFPIPLQNWFAGPLKEQLESAVFHPISGVGDILDEKLLRTAWMTLTRNEGNLTQAFYTLWLFTSWRNQLNSVPRVA